MLFRFLSLCMQSGVYAGGGSVGRAAHAEARRSRDPHSESRHRTPLHRSNHQNPDCNDYSWRGTVCVTLHGAGRGIPQKCRRLALGTSIIPSAALQLHVARRV